MSEKQHSPEYELVTNIQDGKVAENKTLFSQAISTKIFEKLAAKKQEVSSYFVAEAKSTEDDDDDMEDDDMEDGEDECSCDEIRESKEDPILAKVASVIGDAAIVDMRKPLEAAYKKSAVSFSFEPFAHWTIKHKGKTIVITSKKYVDNPDLVHGAFAIGYL
ncbi:MAG: hypothetical protein BV459_00330 [Thermoplasmata archaeon M11B2D]|nr:MAG: hypothetical protein BV459_00330 [Thermoplasmata archaeon M11B2D]